MPTILDLLGLPLLGPPEDAPIEPRPEAPQLFTWTPDESSSGDRLDGALGSLYRYAAGLMRMRDDQTSAPAAPVVSIDSESPYWGASERAQIRLAEEAARALDSIPTYFSRLDHRELEESETKSYIHADLMTPENQNLFSQKQIVTDENSAKAFIRDFIVRLCPDISPARHDTPLCVGAFGLDTYNYFFVLAEKFERILPGVLMTRSTKALTEFGRYTGIVSVRGRRAPYSVSTYLDEIACVLRSSRQDRPTAITLSGYEYFIVRNPSGDILYEG